MRGLRDAGIPYGLYSYAAGWQSITGSWRLPGIPVWATAGHLDYPDEALDRCTQPSFSGGQVHLAQWTDGVYDYNRTCEPYQFTPLPSPPSSLSNSTATGTATGRTTSWPATRPLAICCCTAEATEAPS